MRHHQDVAGPGEFSTLKRMRRVLEKLREILMTDAVVDSADFGLCLADFPDHAKYRAPRGSVRSQQRKPLTNLLTTSFKARQNSHA